MEETGALLDMGEIALNLTSLPLRLPEAEQSTYEFAALLSRSLLPRHTPENFVRNCELILLAIDQRRRLGESGARKKSDYDIGITETQAFLRYEIPRIFDAVLPEAFANEAKQLIKIR